MRASLALGASQLESLSDVWTIQRLASWPRTRLARRCAEERCCVHRAGPAGLERGMLSPHHRGRWRPREPSSTAAANACGVASKKTSTASPAAAECVLVPPALLGLSF